MSSTASRRRKFAWFSAISLGTVFSATTFALGTGSLDEMAVSMGLRTVLATEVSRVYTFGDVQVSVAQLYTRNLSAEGVPYRGVQYAYPADGGEPIKLVEEGRFQSDFGGPISDGIFFETWVADPRTMTARDVQFCTMTAKYRFGLPVYEYFVGVHGRTLVRTAVSAQGKTEREFQLAEQVARQEGWDGSGDVTLSLLDQVRSIDFGTTFDWDYCDGIGPMLSGS